MPRLHFSVYDSGDKKVFLSDRNEVGFTYQQLDALAQVGKSTKNIRADGHKEYIGGTGIGFNCLQSSQRSMDGKRLLRVQIRPRKVRWTDGPNTFRIPADDRVEGHTQFLLEIKREEDYNQIGHDLKELGSQVLLLLRKLKQLCLSIDGEDRTYKLRTKDYNAASTGKSPKSLKE